MHDDPFVKPTSHRRRGCRNWSLNSRPSAPRSERLASTNAEEWVADKLTLYRRSTQNSRVQSLLSETTVRSASTSDFFSWAADKRLSTKTNLVGVRRLLLRAHPQIIEERVKGKAKERADAGRRAASTIGSPGTAAAILLPFSDTSIYVSVLRSVSPPRVGNYLS